MIKNKNNKIDSIYNIYNIDNMNKYYVVLNGRIPGIYSTWTECNQQVFKYKNAKYKSFKLLNQAEEYYNTETIYKMQQHNTISFN